MQVRLLGAHQGASHAIGFMSILLDGRLAIDAGNLCSALSLEEQDRIEAALITHLHYDHIRDLPSLWHHFWETRPLPVYCSRETREALEAHVFNNLLWPSTRIEAPGFYPITWTDVEAGEPFSVLDYRVTPIPMLHTVPTLGYCLEREGKRVFYAADTGSEGKPTWSHIRPDLLIIETTMSSEHDERAARFKHLTPLSLERELRAYYAAQGYFPRTLCVHMNPRHEQQIRIEIAALANKLQADITVGHEGLVVDL